MWECVRTPQIPAKRPADLPIPPTAGSVALRPCSGATGLQGGWKTMLLRIPSSLKGSLSIFFHGTTSEAHLGGQGTRDLQAGMRSDPSDPGKVVRGPPDPAHGWLCGTAAMQWGHRAAGGVENDALKDSFVSAR